MDSVFKLWHVLEIFFKFNSLVDSANQYYEQRTCSKLKGQCAGLCIK